MKRSARALNSWEPPLIAGKNKVRGKEQIISTTDSKAAILVVPTNEELVIARDTVKLVSAE